MVHGYDKIIYQIGYQSYVGNIYWNIEKNWYCTNSIKNQLIFTYFIFIIYLFLLILVSVEDSERNDGSAERPFYMSRRLMNILGTRNQSLSMH